MTIMPDEIHELTTKRYHLQKVLGSGGMGKVYLATDRISNTPVALKVVTTDPINLNFNSKSNTKDLWIALAHEFRVLASLRHPYIISVLDYGFSDDQPFFTMEWLEKSQTITEYALGKPLQVKLKLIVQLLQAMQYLHRRGILHRDLKPDNVLVSNDVVKVLDFGLSANINSTDTSSSGTLAYMAPEIIDQKGFTPVSDLYAVGMISYEVLAEKYPFSKDSISKLIDQILSGMVDYDSAIFSPELIVIMERLLSKAPENRFQSVDDALAALEAMGNVAENSENIQIRESFLQAGSFVGRENEMAILLDGLEKTQTAKTLSYLVGGESGIGKSRLIDEIRTIALTNGLMVLRGRAVSEGATPYQVWRNGLQILALETQLSDEELSVLQSVFPDIGDILGRSVEPPAPRDPQATQRRLIDTIVQVFLRQKKPILFVLEDAHWLGSDSLALLERLHQAEEDLHLMLLVSYRSEEAPDMPEKLPGAEVLMLGRLPENAIMNLSVSILGDMGRQPELLELITKETEGNVLFIVEVMRSLAEDAGKLEKVGTMPLPQSVTTGGIQRIIQNRISRVPKHILQMLEFAAVGGRELSLPILRRQFGDEIDLWLVACSNMAVLMVEEDRWQFAHDKLRESILLDLSMEQRIQLHQKTAEEIEALYPDDLNKAAILAYHWNLVGNIEKELLYTSLAAEQAAKSYANQEAIAYFSRSLELLRLTPANIERDTQELLLLLGMGDPLVSTRGFAAPEVSETFNRAYEISQQIEDVELLLPVHWGLISFYIVSGELERAYSLSKSFMMLADSTEQDDLIRTGRFLMASTRFWTADYEGVLEPMKDLVENANRESDVMFQIAPSEDPVVDALCYLTWAHWLLGYPEKAQQYSEQCIALGRELNHPFSLAYALGFSGWYQQYRRDYETMNALASESIEISLQNDFPYWLSSAFILSGCHQAKQGEKMIGLEQIEEGLEIWGMTGSRLFKPTFYFVKAEALAALGNYEAALLVIDEALSEIPQTGEHLNEPELHRLKGDILAAQGKPINEVIPHYETAMLIATKSKGKAFELRAAISFSTLLLQDGQKEKAQSILLPIYEWFTEGFDTPDLVLARELLEKLV